jgi:Rieske Fe-S protein
MAVAGACGSLPLAGCAGARYAPGTLRGEHLAVRLADFGDETGVLVAHPFGARPIYVHRVGTMAPRKVVAVASDPDPNAEPGAGAEDVTEGERFVALLTRCTHRGCQVDPQGTRLVCPCHGSEYDLDGAVLEGPAERPLRTYPAVREGDVVVVDLSGEGR